MANTPWRRSSVKLEVDSGVEHVEAATVPVSPTAGYGVFWVRSDTPNVPMFTNDAGTDFVLNSSGGAETGMPGTLFENLVFFMDPLDRNSYAGSGTTVVDLIGNATSGTLATATFGDGGFEFNNVSGSITFTKDSDLTDIFSGGGTVVTFVCTKGPGESSGRIVTTEGAGGAVGWLLFTSTESGTGVLAELIRNTSATDGRWAISDIDSLRPIQHGSWNCIGVSYDDSSLTNDPTFYLNGKQVTSTESATPSGTVGSDASENLVIGNRAADDRTFNGTIGVVLIFDRVLSSQEHALLASAFGARYGAGITGRPQSTAALPAANVRIAAGSFIGTTTSTDSNGGNLTLRAGDTSATGSACDGGNLYMYTGSSGGGPSGGFILKGGSGYNAPSFTCEISPGDGLSGNSAGPLLIHGGDNTSTGAAGNLTCRAGNSTSGNGGILYLSGGSAGNADVPGGITLRSGENASALPTTGDILISTDRASGTGGGTGNITIETGENGNNSNPVGTLTLTGGNAAGTGAAGSIVVTAGNNTSVSSSGDGGDITFTCGTSLNGDGGTFTFTAGNSASPDLSDPAGGFVFQAGNMTSGGAVTGSGGGGFTFTGGTSAKTDTSSGGGSFIVTAGASTANSANARGGAVTIEAGDVSSTTAGAIAGSLTLRAGANTGAAANTAGSVVIEGGSPDGNTADTGGSVTIEAGGSNTGSGLTNVIGGAVTIEAGDGIGTGRAGGALSLSSGNGNSAGAITITAGDGLSNGSGGEITIEAGAGNGAGTHGNINFDTNGGSANSGGSICFDTQVGTYTGSEWYYRTLGASLSAGAGSVTVFTVPGPSVNGQNFKVRIWMTVQKATTVADARTRLYEAVYFRSAGTVAILGAALQNQTQVAGTMVPDMAVAVSGNNLNINCTADTVETTRWMLQIEWQRGGMA